MTGSTPQVFLHSGFGAVLGEAVPPAGGGILTRLTDGRRGQWPFSPSPRRDWGWSNRVGVGRGGKRLRPMLGAS